MKKKQRGAQLAQKLSTLKNELNMAYGEFDRESNHDMIDARIYDINSLKAQYAHYLALARNEGITAHSRVRDGFDLFPAAEHKESRR